jgi:tungstate transport system ATP-binding protein
MLECRGVVQRYGQRTVLRVDALTVEAGARLALVGPNGAGKSTLLRLLAFLETPREGSISVDGHAVVTAAARRAARRRVTLVEQRPFLFRGSVLANVAWGLHARGVPAAAAARAAREALTVLEGGPLAERDARALSEGEVQRVAVARALALQPDVLLLDEPVSGADRAAQHALYAAIAAAQMRRPMAVCVASHQLEDAYRWADRILALHDGAPTPVTPDNLFRVQLAGGGGMQRVTIGAVTIDVVSDRTGSVTLAIPPEEIVLSTVPLESSARNVIAGRIVRVAEQGAAMRVTVAGGIELVALITRRSFEDLKLTVGGPVVASFKSVAVRVF